MIFTVDTSLVHMAGTMNKKTFLFLPKVPDYRWGLKNNQEWYPSVSLLRQEKVSDWKKPIEDWSQKWNGIILILACCQSQSLVSVRILFETWLIDGRIQKSLTKSSMTVLSFSVMVKRKAVESGENEQPGERGENQPAEKRPRWGFFIIFSFIYLSFKTHAGEYPELKLYNALTKYAMEKNESLAVFHGLNLVKFEPDRNPGKYINENSLQRFFCFF
mgnify:CR=1 FL=1